MITRRLARPLSAFSSSNAWTCPACARSTSLLQHRQRQRPSHPQQQQRRTLISIPPLEFDTTFRADGVPGLLSSTGYQIAWTTYQSMIHQKLNELISGEPYENSRVRDLVIQFARDPMNASLFNHASMAHNNHFFFSTLSVAPQDLSYQPDLQESLEHTFGSIDTLRTTFLDTAAAMFGPGFVWLVWASDTSPATTLTGRKGSWKILTTYLAGTPYPEAGYRQQGLDMNTSNSSTYDAYVSSQPANYAGAFGSHSQSGREQASIPPGGTKVMPVLCVNTWEHVYIYDYGLPGKRKYLADWWDAVNWHQVSVTAPSEIRPRRFEG